MREALRASSSRLRSGAEHTRANSENSATRYFQALLEVGYLVASADGLSDEERHALGELLEQVSGSAVDRESFELHFRDLDDACSALGRRERLRRTAEEFEDRAAREEALGFGILVASADGKFARPEADALLELSDHFGFSEQETRAIVERVVERVKRALES